MLKGLVLPIIRHGRAAPWAESNPTAVIWGLACNAGTQGKGPKTQRRLGESPEAEVLYPSLPHRPRMTLAGGGGGGEAAGGLRGGVKAGGCR